MKEIVNKAYRFRIYPDEEQKVFLAKHFGCTRFIYNYLLDKRSSAWKKEKRNIGGAEAKRMISPLKKEKGKEWLKEPNSQSLQAASINLDKAFKKFFKKEASYPKFKKKNDRQSFEVPQNFQVDAQNNFIKIPKLSTAINTVYHRSLKKIKKICYLTLSKEPSGKYYVSMNVEEEIVHRRPVAKITKRTKAVGIDLGLKDFLVESNGQKVTSPKYLRSTEKKLKREQRKLSKKSKGSKNRYKQRQIVAKIHEKIRHQRHDFLHKQSFRLVRENQVIFVEDLNVKGMMKNRHLSKSIADAGWGEFTRQLKYKAQWFGSVIFQIGRFEPSSKLCSTEGCDFKHTKDSLKLSDREWRCPWCNTLHDRDINAAMNIEAIGRVASKSRPVEKSTSAPSERKVQVDSLKQESLSSS